MDLKVTASIILFKQRIISIETYKRASPKKYLERECYISYSKCLYQELWPSASLHDESRTGIGSLGMRLQKECN